MTPRRILLASLVLITAFGCGGRSNLKRHPDGGRRDAGTADGSRDGQSAEVRRDGSPDGARDGSSDGGRDGGDASADRPDAPADTGPATLASITVVPQVDTIHTGTTLEFKATGIYSNGTTENLTTLAAWKSSNPAAASVSLAGLASAVAAGTTTITATYRGVSGTARLTVVASKLVRLTVAPVDPTWPVGVKQQMSATGIYDDDSKQDLTRQAELVWKSSNATVASVESSRPGAGQVTTLKAGTATISASYQSLTGGSLVTVEASPLTSIEVTPPNPTLAHPAVQQLTATGVYASGAAADITASVKWDSSDPSVLRVSDDATTKGSATTTGMPGNSRVTAALGSVSGSTMVTVKNDPVSVTVTPSATKVARGALAEFTAKAGFADGSYTDVTATALWSAADPTVASPAGVSNGKAAFEGLKPGSTTVTARVGTVSGSATLTVTDATVIGLAIEPQDSSVAMGRQLQYELAATFSDGSKSVATTLAIWKTGDASIAGISNAEGSAGLLTGLKLGTTEVSASFGGRTAMTKVVVSDKVLDRIDVQPATGTVAAGLKLAFTATGVYSDGSTPDLTTQVSWSSDDTKTATVSNASGSRGVAVGVRQGVTTIHARLDGKDGTATLTITPPDMTQLSIAPLMPSRRVGQNTQFTATAINSDGTSRDVTTRTTWSSSDGSIATISTAGRASCASQGTTTIKASYSSDGKSLSASTQLYCEAATIIELQLQPFLATLASGENQRFTAILVYSDGSTRDRTDESTWISSAPDIAGVDTSNQPGRVTGASPGTATITASYRDRDTNTVYTASATVTVRDAKLLSISVSPPVATLAAGEALRFTATGLFDDGTSRNLTNQSTWVSSDRAVAEVTSSGERGRVAALKVGSTTITATYSGPEGIFSDSASLTVSAAVLTAISITPIAASIVVGQNINFEATALYDDGSSRGITGAALWSTSDAGVVDVSNDSEHPGRATGLAGGSATITATYQGKSDSAGVTVRVVKPVSLSLSDASATLHKGQNLQLEATVLYDDGTRRGVTGAAAWTSSAPGVADVANANDMDGRVTAISAGTAVITATFAGLSDSATITVLGSSVQSLSVAPAVANLHIAQNLELVATAIFDDGTRTTVTGASIWTSSNPSVADVSNAGDTRGRVTGLAAGTVTVTATFAWGGSSFTDTATITVLEAKPRSLSIAPIAPRIVVGENQRFEATVIYDDGSLRTVTGGATWTSSDASVADIATSGDNAGRATGLKAGTTTIKATWNGLSDTATLTVTSATVTSLSVSPIARTLHIGQMQDYVAVAIYSDGTRNTVTGQAYWESSNPGIAEVSNGTGTRGRVTAIAAGSVTITASYGGLSDSQTLTVIDSKPIRIEVTPVAATLTVGQSHDYVAIAVYDDLSTRDVTGGASWTSSDGSVADVSNAPDTRGRVTALAAGSASISATWSALSGSAVLTVSSATLSAIEVTPVNLSLPVGVIGRQYEAVALYSDGTRRNVTGQATWISSKPSVADVSNQAGGSRGDVSTLSPGTTEISATLNGVTGKTALTVTDATVLELQIAPTNPLVMAGTTQQFTAQAVLSDYTVLGVTGASTWASTDTGVAQVSNASGSRGLTTAIAAGSATISATYRGVTATTIITVSGGSGTIIQITPTNPSSPVGVSMRFVATAITAGGQASDVTNDVTWTSSNGSVASISNAAGSHGLATALAAGSTTITATLGGASGQTTYSVGSQTLSSIAVSAASDHLAVGATQQCTAIGTYSDSSTYDITAFATWLSSASSVATVSNAANYRGLATGVSAGTTDIQAHFQGQSGSAALAVP